jgi:SAM-dependent methyltransferase
MWLASEGAFVTCSDLNGPRPGVRERHLAAGFMGRIEYASVDASDIQYEQEFDVVVFKSVLGAIGDPCTAVTQARAVAQMHKALKSGGELLFAENLAASPIHSFFRRKFVKWGRTWRYPTIEEMLGFLAPFSGVSYSTLGFAGTFGRTESQRGLLGEFDRLLLNRLVPSGWRYIMAGVARK